VLINTPDGWRTITGRPPRSIREADTYRELAAKMADELAELCPSMGTVAAAQAASMLAKTLAGMR
jgi:hypothetical protein